MSILYQELANGGSHLVGSFLSLFVLVSLMRLTRDLPRARIGCVVFALSMLVVYTASASFHLGFNCPLRKMLLMFDMVGILVLIAGTATGYLLIQPDERLPVLRIAVIWGATIIVASVQIFVFDLEVQRVLLSDLVLASVVIPIVNWGRKPCCPYARSWLLHGGIAYVAGIPFMTVPVYGHLVWHCLVLIGSVCHFCSFVQAVTCRR